MRAMGPKLNRLDHLAVYVSDLERAERFYVEVLGLERVMRLPDQVLLRLHDVNIGLMHTAHVAPPDPSILENPLGKAHHAFLIGAQDLDAWRSRLASHRVPTSEIVDWGDHRCLYFLDPDGNLLEIVTPPAHGAE
jgi:catechol 2,3-dioxygenase-like lactoylglutathione lyase family enzyme